MTRRESEVYKFPRHVLAGRRHSTVCPTKRNGDTGRGLDLDALEPRPPTTLTCMLARCAVREIFGHAGAPGFFRKQRRHYFDAQIGVSHPGRLVETCGFFFKAEYL